MTDLNIVVPADLQLEGRLKGDVLLLHRLDVDLSHHTAVRHNLIPMSESHGLSILRLIGTYTKG